MAPRIDPIPPSNTDEEGSNLTSAEDGSHEQLDTPERVARSAGRLILSGNRHASVLNAFSHAIEELGADRTAAIVTGHLIELIHSIKTLRRLLSLVNVSPEYAHSSIAASVSRLEKIGANVIKSPGAGKCTGKHTARALICVLLEGIQKSGLSTLGVGTLDICKALSVALSIPCSFAFYQLVVARWLAGISKSIVDELLSVVFTFHLSIEHQYILGQFRLAHLLWKSSQPLAAVNVSDLSASWFLKYLQEIKGVPSDAAECFTLVSPLLSNLDLSKWDELFLPQIERLLLRNAPLALLMLESFCNVIPLEFFLNKIVPMLCPSLLGDNQSVREQAVKVIGNTARQLKSLSQWNMLKSILDTTLANKATSWNVKLSLFEAYSSLIYGPFCDKDALFKVLVNLATKETNESVLACLCDSIGKVSLDESCFIPMVEKILADGFKSPKGGVRAAFLLVISNQHLLGSLKPLSIDYLRKNICSIEGFGEVACILGLVGKFQHDIISDWSLIIGDAIKPNGLLTEKGLLSLTPASQTFIVAWIAGICRHLKSSRPKSQSNLFALAKVIVWLAINGHGQTRRTLLESQKTDIPFFPEYYEAIVKAVNESLAVSLELDPVPKISKLLSVLVGHDKLRLSYLVGVSQRLSPAWKYLARHARGDFDCEYLKAFVQTQLLAQTLPKSTATMIEMMVPSTVSTVAIAELKNVLAECQEPVTEFERKVVLASNTNVPVGEVITSASAKAKKPISTQSQPTSKDIENQLALEREIRSTIEKKRAKLRYLGDILSILEADQLRKAGGLNVWWDIYRYLFAEPIFQSVGAKLLYITSTAFAKPLGPKASLMVSILIRASLLLSNDAVDMAMLVDSNWNLPHLPTMAKIVLEDHLDLVHLPLSTDDLVIVITMICRILMVSKDSTVLPTVMFEVCLCILDRLLGDTFIPDPVRVLLLQTIFDFAVPQLKATHQLDMLQSILVDLASLPSHLHDRLSSGELEFLRAKLVDPLPQVRFLAVTSLATWADCEQSQLVMKKDRVLELLAWLLTHDDGIELENDSLDDPFLDNHSMSIEEAISSNLIVPAPMEKATSLWVALYGKDSVLSVNTHLDKLVQLLSGSFDVDPITFIETISPLELPPPPIQFLSKCASESIVDIFSQDPSKIFNALVKEWERLWSRRVPTQPFLRAKVLDISTQGREAIAETFKLAPFDSVELLPLIPTTFSFFLEKAFFDSAPRVNEAFLQAAQTILDLIMNNPNNSEILDTIIRILERFLAAPAKADHEHDRVRVFVIILLGSASQFIPTEDRRNQLVDILVDSLHTPAESVQQAVSDALVPLLKRLDRNDQRISTLLTKFSANLFEATGQKSTMAIRRGSAYGLAALFKSQGIVFLSPLVQKTFIEPLDGSRSPESKQGSLFAIELTCRALGRSFEPYAVRLMPLLLNCFADNRTEVREATNEAAIELLAHLSAPGVRLVLPKVLHALQEEGSAWRAKVGALEWLGVMTNVAPKVLLPQLHVILPALIRSLTDSHREVQRASRASLSKYIKVIKSPEVAALLPALLEALADPPGQTGKCLEKILTTRFAHLIDGPSLALLEPVLTRALRDRAAGGAEVRKRAAQIVANLVTNLVDVPEMTPYLPRLVPALVDCLCDPVPTVRAHVAKVLGMLVRRIIEEDGRSSLALEQVFPQLIKTLDDENIEEITAVDRAGAAQAIAEIVSARGVTHICNLLHSTVIPGLKSAKSSIREGYIMVIGYIPGAFEYYGSMVGLYKEGGFALALPAVLSLQSDESESVREQSSKTSRIVVERMTLVDPLGVFDRLLIALDENRWRVRLLSISLLQEFLIVMSGTKGKGGNEDNDDDSSSEANAEGYGKEGEEASISLLPTAEELERRGIIDKTRIQMLQSRVFLARFDQFNSQIRQIALTLWKALSIHPFRTLMQVLPSLLKTTVQLLGGNMGPSPSDAVVGDAKVPVGITGVSRVVLKERREMIYRGFEDILFKLGDRLVLSMVSGLKDLFLSLVAEHASSDIKDESFAAMYQGIIECLCIVIEMSGNPGVPYANSPSIIKNLILEVSAVIKKSIAVYPEGSSQLFSSLITTLARTYPDELESTVESIVKPLIDQEGLVNFVKAEPQVVLPVVIPMALSSNHLQLTMTTISVEWVNRMTKIITAAGFYAGAYVVDLVEAILATVKNSKDGEDQSHIYSLLKCILSVLNYSDEHEDDQNINNDEDAESVCDREELCFEYEVEFSQLLEKLYAQEHKSIAKVDQRPWAYQLIRLRCECSSKVDRFIPIWLDRLLRAAFDCSTIDNRNIIEPVVVALEAIFKHPLPSLGEDTTIEIVRVLSTTLSSLNTITLHSIHSPMLSLMTKNLLVPAIVQPGPLDRVRYITDAINSLVKSTNPTDSPWGSALTMLTGALIRVGSDRKGTLFASRHLYLLSLSSLVDRLRTLLKPFYPQLQRLFSQYLTCQVETSEIVPIGTKLLGSEIKLRKMEAEGSLHSISRRVMVILVPLLPRPEQILLEWLHILCRYTDGDEETPTTPTTTSDLGDSDMRINLIQTITELIEIENVEFHTKLSQTSIGTSLSQALKLCLLVDKDDKVRNSSVDLVRRAVVKGNQVQWLHGQLGEVEEFIKSVI